MVNHIVLLLKKYNFKSTGMLANWKKQYLNETLSKDDNRGRKRQECDDFKILKKCFAQLTKIRLK